MNPTPRTVPVLPGTGRLGIVRSYFDINAVFGVVGTCSLAALTLSPSLPSVVTLPPHPWLLIVAGAFFTWGAIQTSRMLRDRQRTGAWAASFTFAASLVVTGVHPVSLITAGLALVGLGLLASVWRYLE